MVCLFKAKLNETEWEGGGVAPGPHSFFWPGSIQLSLSPPHMFMQFRDQGRK